MEDDEPVAVFQEAGKGDVVAAAKRNADHQALLKQRRDNVMNIDAPMNSEPLLSSLMVVSEPIMKKSKARKTTKAS